MRAVGLRLAVLCVAAFASAAIAQPPVQVAEETYSIPVYRWVLRVRPYADALNADPPSEEVLKREAGLVEMERRFEAARTAWQSDDAKGATQILERILASPPIDDGAATLVKTRAQLFLCEIFQSAESLDRARSQAQRLAEQVRGSYGERHFLLTDARLITQHVNRWSQLSPIQRRQLDGARQQLATARQGPEDWEVREARYFKSLDAAISLFGRLLGTSDVAYVDLLATQARARAGQPRIIGVDGAPQSANERDLQNYVSAVARVYGPQHPRHGMALYEQGKLLEALAVLKNYSARDPLEQYTEYGFWDPAILWQELEDAAAEHLAEGRGQQAAAIHRALADAKQRYFGEGSWQAVDAQLEIKLTEKLAALSTEDQDRLAPVRQKVRTAAQVNPWGDDPWMDANPGRAAEEPQAAQDPVEVLEHLDIDDPRYRAAAMSLRAASLAKERRTDEAAALYQQSLHLLREPFGGSALPLRLQIFAELDRLYLQLASDRYVGEDFIGAEQTYGELTRLREEQLGRHHWHAADARRWKEFAGRLAAAGAAEQARLLGARRLANEFLEETDPYQKGAVATSFGAGDTQPGDEASPRDDLRRGEQTLAIAELILGDGDDSPLRIMTRMAGIYESLGHLDRVAQIEQRRLDLAQRARGLLDPSAVDSLLALSDISERLGEHEKAEQLSVRAAVIGRRIGYDVVQSYETGARTVEVEGEVTAGYIADLRKTMKACTQTGDYITAAPIARQIVEATRKLYGEQHFEHAVSLANLANVYVETGDYLLAQDLYRKAIPVFQKGMQPAQRRANAVALHNLGVLYEKTEQFAKAKEAVSQELESLRAANESRTLVYARSLGTLATIQTHLGETAEAVETFRRSLALLEQLQAPKTGQAYLDAKSGLGFALVQHGSLDEAEQVLVEASIAQQEQFGGNHDDVASTLHDLAVLRHLQQRKHDAASLFDLALEITWTNIERASLVQSPRQQMAMAEAFQRRLDSYLSFAVEAGLPAADVYGQALLWKGKTLLRRQDLLDALADDELKGLAAELNSAAARIAAMAHGGSFASPPLDGQEQTLEQLAAAKEDLERRLSARYFALRGNQPFSPPRGEDVTARLPESVVLADFLEYRHIVWGPGGGGLRGAEPRLLAFVSRGDGDVQLVPLGSAAPIREAIIQWRKTFGRAGAGADGPGEILRRLVWTPIEQHLQENDIVLIAPDSFLTLLPFPALPGRKAGEYLVQERAIAVVPGAAFLREAAPPAPDDAAALRDASLLLVGYVDYGLPPPIEANPVEIAAADRARLLHSWDRLPGTLGEMGAIRLLFETQFKRAVCRMLPGRDAHEFSLRDEAPNCRWLHLATHGFFAEPIYPRWMVAQKTRESWERSSWMFSPGSGESPQVSWDITAFHPDLLSGVALAGANASLSGGPREPQYPDDDGLLTAFEIAGMDLSRVELAVLSACETGLGEYQRGEGLLSLQRAFHMAGVPAVVASLWKVDDQTTSQLMQLFYANLWEHRMSKIEALRQAQITILKEGKSRSLKILEEHPEERNGTLPPYYWAAFVLSGDWR